MADTIINNKIEMHKYKAIIWKGLIIPTREVIKFLSLGDLEEVRRWLSESLDGNAITIKNVKNEIYCLDRADIRKIIVKEIK